jgi:hypothetical protein
MFQSLLRPSLECFTRILIKCNMGNCYTLSASVKNQVPFSYKIRGNCVILYTVVFLFSDSNPEDRRFWTKW